VAGIIRRQAPLEDIAQGQAFLVVVGAVCSATVTLTNTGISVETIPKKDPYEHGRGIRVSGDRNYSRESHSSTGTTKGPSESTAVERTDDEPQSALKG